MMKFTGTILLILFATFAFTEASVQKQDYKQQKIADGIYAFIADESITGAVQGNIVLIVGETEALIVDSGQYPSLAKRILKDVQVITKNPVTYLVNTHWHGDHLLSNFVFQDAYPGLRTIAHFETKIAADKVYATWKEEVKGFPKMIEALRKAVETGKRKDGTALSETELLAYEVDAGALENMIDDMNESKYTPPQITFQKELTLYLGKREVKIMNLGYANTKGDAIIYIPDSKVLITGDTVVYPSPYSFGSYHTEWIDVLNQMIALNADQIIPGHGPVMKDSSYLKTVIALLEDVRTQVQAAVKEGLSLEDTRKRVNLKKWSDQLAGDNKYRRRGFTDFFESPGIEQAYKEAKGPPREN